MNQPQEVPPQQVMMQIISGFWLSQMVNVAARLGLADQVAGQSKTLSELAAATGTHAPSLYRVLRALISTGILAQNADGKFASTPLSETLRSDVPGSLRAFAMAELGQEHFVAWGNLMHSVKTGEIAFDNHFGQSAWEYYATHPEDAAVFNDAMTGLTEMVNSAVVAAYDFSGFEKAVDIGGGHGALMAAILKTNPALQGAVFDLPHVTEGAIARLKAEGVSGRCEILTGDFFKSVPAGYDAYLMKFIIHDWNDEQSIAILKNIRGVMAEGGKLLLVEQIVAADNSPSFAKFIDINMLVMTGGCERTEKEFADLYAASGFKLSRVIFTESPFCVIEAVAA
ncbi:MAG: helix-turn-helix domain-containing protein [Acidobacteria bacterium]|nr:helix-turn-helix domain-containing protein [Acidobacteriota bacterium]